MIKRIIFRSILFLLLLIILGGAFFTMTTSGLRAGIAVANKFIPGKIQVGEISGALIKKVNLTNIDYQYDKNEIYIQNIQLNWNPLALFTGRIYINKLYVSNAKIKLAKNKPIKEKKEPSSKKKSFGSLPLDITANDISLKYIDIIQNNKQLTYIDHIQLQANTDDDVITIKKLDFSTNMHQGNLSGDVQLKTPFKADLDGMLISNYPGYKPITTKLKLAGDLKKQISLSLNVNDPFKASLTATIKQALQQGPINVNGHWENLLIPFGNSNTISSTSGQIKITGTLKNYHLNIDTNIAGKNIPTGQWRIYGDGNLKDINLNKIIINTLNGQISGNVKLGWDPNLNWQGLIYVRLINPGLKWKGWAGNVNFNLQSNGWSDPQNPQFYVHINNIFGKLHQHALGGHFECEFKNKKLNIPQSQLTIGSDFLKIYGQLSNIWNLHWSLNIPNIAEILPNATGRISSKGQITGDSSKPNIQGNLTAQRLNLNKFSLQSLNATVNANLAAPDNTKVTFYGENLRYQKNNIKKLNLSLTGGAKSHRLHANIQTPKSNFKFNLSGQYLNNAWNEQLHDLDLQSNTLPHWHLKEPVPMTITNEATTVSPFCLISSSGQICGQLNVASSEDWNATLTSKSVPAGIFATFLPQEISLKTNIDTNINLTKKDNKITGSVSLQTTAGQLIDTKNPFNTIQFAPSQLTATFDKKGLTSNLTINTNKAKPVNITFTLPEYFGDHLPKNSQKIKGNASINFNTLDLLTSFIPQINQIRGQFKLNTDITGTWGTPQLIGNMSIENGQAEIDSLKITLKNINLSANANKNNKIKINGSIQSNEGQININGTSSFNHGSFPTDLTITGTNLRVINTDEYSINVSPNLKINYVQPKLTISGKINIPKAIISPQDFTSTTTLPSNVIIVSGSKDSYKKNLLEPYLNVDIIPGENVHISAFGLSAKLGGQLTINSSPSNLTTGTGTLNVLDGKYQAYGQKLIIDNGTLSFVGGPIDNPQLNIRAIKRIRQATRPVSSAATTPGAIMSAAGDLQHLIVGIQITGSAEQPDVKLFSEPAGISDTNILSYLVLGSPSGETSGAEGQMLFQAAQAMGVGGTNITSDIKKTFGLSDFGMESQTSIDEDGGSTSTPAFAIGKYITPRIYLHYSISILTASNILNVTYYITHKLMVRSETSTRENGADIFYVFQSD
jgi:translocation and assembly module TamB